MKPNYLKRGATYAFLLLIVACSEEATNGESNNHPYMDSVSNYDLVEEATTESDDVYMTEEPEIDYFNTEEYAYLPENEFLSPGVNPLSTFSIDVDNASYTNVRRILNEGRMPSVDAVRTEEFINYFNYDYPIPEKEDVFLVYTELGQCPWNRDNQLLHVGLKGYTVPIGELPPANLVFLLDVSGSMDDQNKLPLLKRSFKMMVDNLNAKDRVSIVTYAGDERLVLPSTSCENKAEIIAAIDNLSAGGATNGEGGIEMAYQQAVAHFIKEGNNRVILATDGDFNIGKSSGGDLTRLIEEKRDLGVYLTILGFGMGNYKDAQMESLANNGDGNYFYIDDILESNHVLVDNLAGTLFTIAKDVKIQVEFNPAVVKEYRLIGYENRLMNAEDFVDDKKDAGELGAGHTVTALYEIVPGEAVAQNLKYQNRSTEKSTEWATIKLRFKRLNQSKSELVERVVYPSNHAVEETSHLFRFSAGVAAFSLLLRKSKYNNDFTYSDVEDLVKSALLLSDLDKVSFLEMVEKARLLDEQ